MCSSWFQTCCITDAIKPNATWINSRLVRLSRILDLQKTTQPQLLRLFSHWVCLFVSDPEVNCNPLTPLVCSHAGHCWARSRDVTGVFFSSKWVGSPQCIYSDWQACVDEYYSLDAWNEVGLVLQLGSTFHNTLLFTLLSNHQILSNIKHLVFKVSKSRKTIKI